MKRNNKYLVTGASSGIGLATVNRLLADGAKVTGISRRSPAVDNVEYAHCFVDFSKTNTLEKSFKEVVKSQAKWDALICVAGFGQFSTLEQFSFQQMQDLMNVNFMAHALLIKLMLGEMKKHKQGRVIIIGSEAALQGGKNGAMYCASKFALRGLAQSLREECAKSGIHVSMINPGMVRTPFFKTLDFRPGAADENAIDADDVAVAVQQVLAMRNGTNVDEINLSPLKHVIDFESR